MATDAKQKKRKLGSIGHVLAIDLGSGGPKAAVVSETGQVMASAEAPITAKLRVDFRVFRGMACGNCANGSN